MNIEKIIILYFLQHVGEKKMKDMLKSLTQA